MRQQERLAQAQRLYDEGETYVTISKILGVSASTVSRWHRRNWQTPTEHTDTSDGIRPRRAWETIKDYIAYLIRRGISDADIAEMIGDDWNTERHRAPRLIAGGSARNVMGIDDANMALFAAIIERARLDVECEYEDYREASLDSAGEYQPVTAQSIVDLCNDLARQSGVQHGYQRRHH